jgi:hypothetical protein
MVQRPENVTGKIKNKHNVKMNVRRSERPLTHSRMKSEEYFQLLLNAVIYIIKTKIIVP